jgi:hypothetical protein
MKTDEKETIKTKSFADLAPLKAHLPPAPAEIVAEETALIKDLTTVIIPRRHQSAPKEHWADKELRKAAQEIHSGNQPIPQDPNEYFNYGPTQFLARHPRVQEAMAKLESEKEESNSQEAAEKAQMIWEMNEMANKPDHWDGEGRWIGKDNEAMRTVNIMSPFAFMERLYASGVPERRVKLNTFAVRGRAALLASELDLKTATRKLVQVGTLQYPCGPEWMVMRFNEYGVPTTAKYLGWRTALLSMITLGVLSEKEAHKAFPLKEGPASAWYQEQLMMLRGKVQKGKYAN